MKKELARGLTLAHDFIKQNGESIEADSTVGFSPLLTLYFPLIVDILNNLASDNTNYNHDGNSKEKEEY